MNSIKDRLVLDPPRRFDYLLLFVDQFGIHGASGELERSPMGQYRDGKAQNEGKDVTKETCLWLGKMGCGECVEINISVG